MVRIQQSTEPIPQSDRYYLKMNHSASGIRQFYVKFDPEKKKYYCSLSNLKLCLIVWPLDETEHETCPVTLLTPQTPIPFHIKNQVRFYFQVPSTEEEWARVLHLQYDLNYKMWFTDQGKLKYCSRLWKQVSPLQQEMQKETSILQQQIETLQQQMKILQQTVKKENDDVMPYYNHENEDMTQVRTQTQTQTRTSPRQTQTQMEPPLNERYYLHVPYEQREVARSLGCRWDNSRKKWYCFQNNLAICAATFPTVSPYQIQETYIPIQIPAVPFPLQQS